MRSTTNKQTDGIPRKAYFDFIKRVADYYGGRVQPTEGAIKEWITELAKYKIPEQNLNQIFDQIKLGKSFPSNFPLAVAEIHRSIAGDQKQQQGPGCEECDGGLLYVKRRSDKHPSGWEQTIFRCLRCKSVRMAIPGAFAGNVKNDGWIIYDVHNDPQWGDYNRSATNAGAYIYGEAGRLEAEGEQMGRGYGYAEAGDRERRSGAGI